MILSAPAKYLPPASTTVSATPAALRVVRSILLLLLACSLPAQAVYKCRIDGTLTYSDLPCGSDTLDVQSAQASPHNCPLSQESLRHEKAEIARLQRFREQRERQDQQIRDLAVRGAALRERKCRSLSSQLRWREEDLRNATLQEERKARVRARRAAEKLAQECQ